MNKKVIYVGGGPASIISSIILKKYRPDIDVLIIEKNNHPLKKLRMTGNGKCNIAPIKDEINRYNNQNFVQELFEDITLDEYLKTLNDVGISLKTINNYGYYPISESAPNVAQILLNQCHANNIKIINDLVVDYRLKNNVIIIRGEKGEYQADYVVFGCGGKAHPETGSDGSLFGCFKSHGYSVNNLEPSLCPIKVKERISSLFGVRGEGLVSLFKDGKFIKSEFGEIMFKKDALSGICVMNLSKYIVDNPEKYSIVIDFTYGLDTSSFCALTIYDYLLSVCKEPLAKYVLNKLDMSAEEKASPSNIDRINEFLKQMTFTCDSLYGFKDAQTSRGGILINEINKKFSSLREKNVYFIGEVLDVDGECGGYNLRFSITSGIKVATTLKEM